MPPDVRRTPTARAQTDQGRSPLPQEAEAITTTRRDERSGIMATAPENEVVTDTDERTKPPFLRRVRIRGYKSIAFCDVALQPLTILVGRNGAGKSNFLDALAFLRDAIQLNVAEALKRRGGAHSILCRSAPNDSLSIEV